MYEGKVFYMEKKKFLIYFDKFFFFLLSLEKIVVDDKKANVADVRQVNFRFEPPTNIQLKEQQTAHNAHFSITNYFSTLTLLSR